MSAQQQEVCAELAQMHLRAFVLVTACRAFLDAQAAAKGRQQHCDQLEQQQLLQQHKQRVQQALGAADDPSAYS